MQTLVVRRGDVVLGEVTLPALDAPAGDSWRWGVGMVIAAPILAAVVLLARRRRRAA